MPAENYNYSIEDGLRLRRSPKSHIEKAQLTLLRKHFEFAGKATYYSKVFDKIGLKSDRISKLADLSRIPLTSRQEIEKHTPDFSPHDIAISDISHTSGTTGEPVIVPYTENDLKRLAYNEAMAFHSAGIKSKDRILLTVTLDRCFIAGLAYYMGATLLGATAIRSGPGQPAQQWQLIKRLKPTILLGVPSFLVALARWGKEHGFESKTAGIQTIITIGEPIRTADMKLSPLGSLLQENWDARVCSSYGATEVETAFGECQQECGGHVHPELMLLEIVDENGKSQPDGQPGEVVVTPLGVEGFPLLRFRTGDIARKHTSQCSCGLNTERLGPIEGRISQRLKYKGTTLYPDTILQVLQEIPGTDDSYIEVRELYNLADEITIVIGSDQESLDTDKIQGFLQARLRVKPKIVQKNLQEVLLKTGKGKRRKPLRFFDLR